MQNPYETDRLVADYLFFHYVPHAEGSEGLPLPSEAWDFASRIVSELIDASQPARRALDLGCAVGRSSFELSRKIPDVLGIDFSRAFIDAAERMRTLKSIDASVPAEGQRQRPFTARLPEGIDPERTRFTTGDAMNLPSDLGAFDIVLAANLLCRLPDPAQLLKRLPDLVAPGGQLLLATPFSWLEEFTPRAHWIGGLPDSASSFEILTSRLAPHFTLEHTTNLPFLIREHSRKYQYGISLGSRWRRH